MKISLKSATCTALLALLSACSPDNAAPPNDALTSSSEARPQGDAAVGIELVGRWRVALIDGQPPAAGRLEASRLPLLTFGQYQFGGSVGCNQFGGLGLVADGHYAVHSVAGDAIGCGKEVAGQEQAVSRLFLANPRVQRLTANRLRLQSDEHVLELERVGEFAGPRVAAGPVELSGSTFRITGLDGQVLTSRDPNRLLRFEENTWRARVACATLSGTWRRQGDQILLGGEIVSTEQNCRADHVRLDEAFAQLMRSRPHFLVGPNGELLLAGGGHALKGERLKER